MSTTSDSDEDSEERRDLMSRMQQFRAKRNQEAAAVPSLVPAAEEDAAEDSPLCVQIGWPPDYIEYTGIQAACRQRGWQVVGADRRPLADPSSAEPGRPAATRAGGSGGAADEDACIPNVQFVPYKKTAWAALMKGQVVANHYYMRSGLVRKAELATTLLPHLRACHPETYVTELVDAVKRDEFAELLVSLADRGGLWLIKAGDSSNATDMYLFDRGNVDRICGLMLQTPRTSWLVQSYIHRPLLVKGRKFHIRATVLAVGRLKVYLHRHAIALLASRQYSLDDLDDLRVHASNHSVAERLDPAATPEGLLLAHLAQHLQAPPNIVDLAAEEAAEAAQAARPAWTEIADAELGGGWAAAVWRQLREATWSVFHSAVNSKQPARIFRPVPCSFEMFGMDAMVDQAGRVWLLELNCDPDLKVFDERFNHVAKEIMDDTIEAAVCSTMPRSLPSARALPTSAPASSEPAAGNSAGDRGAETCSWTRSTSTRRDDETGGEAGRDIGGYHLVFEFSGPDRYFEPLAPTQ